MPNHGSGLRIGIARGHLRHRLQAGCEDVSITKARDNAKDILHLSTVKRTAGTAMYQCRCHSPRTEDARGSNRGSSRPMEPVTLSAEKLAQRQADGGKYQLQVRKRKTVANNNRLVACPSFHSHSDGVT